MATYNKFYPFVEAIAEKVHNLGSDQLAIALLTSAGTPSATYSGYSQISASEISYTNLSGQGNGVLITTAFSSAASGVYVLGLTDITLTASGAGMPAFRYVVLYNKTASASDNNLIGWWDYGASVTLQDTETFAINFNDAYVVRISG